MELARDHRNALGLSVVGGTDHCSHPFGINKPGVFISKISVDSPAAKSRRLRIGDRIIAVNGRNLENARHNEAVEVRHNGQNVLCSLFLGAFTFNQFLETHLTTQV